VAVGVEVTFQCQLADRLTSYWVVNNVPGIPQFLNDLRNRGFFIERHSRDGIVTLSLRVTATMNMNGTEIFCSSAEGVRTEHATIVVIKGMS
jgi:hypothetical protein